MRLISVSLILTVGLIYAWRQPATALLSGIALPMVSLPLVVFAGHFLKYFSLGCQLLAIFAAVAIVAKSKKRNQILPLQWIILVAFLLLLFGMVIQDSQNSILILLIESKIVLFPIIVSGSAILGINFIRRLITTLFFLVIAGSIAAIFEIGAGTGNLISAGLLYGTNVIVSTTGSLRAPGLSLTSFDFSLISGLAVLVALLNWSNYFVFEKKYSRKFLLIVIAAGLTGVFTSVTRSGLLFFIVAYAIYAISNSKKIGRAIVFFYVAAAGLSIVLIKFSAFLSTSSLHQRFLLWRFLLSGRNLFYGMGLGTVGSVTNSSFTPVANRLVADNYYVNIILQFGIPGLMLFAIMLWLYWRFTDRCGKSMIVGLMVTALVTEIWEYPDFMAFLLIFVVSNGLKKNSSLTSATKIMNRHLNSSFL